MKKNKITTIFIIFLSLFTTQITAQDGYTYTLIDNDSYSFTIGAVPNTSSNNFATSVQSYGFTIIVPDGVTISITSSLGNAASATFFDGNAVAQPTVDGYLITETLGTPATLVAPSSGTTSSFVTFQVNGSPTDGAMYILENNSTLATTVTLLKSFMQADMIDNGSAEFVNVVDPNALGVSGTSSIDFSTFSIEKEELSEVSIYPNPVNDVLYINSSKPIDSVLINTINGQLVKQFKTPQTSYSLTDLQTGIYLVTIQSEFEIKTLKIVKK